MRYTPYLHRNEYSELYVECDPDFVAVNQQYNGIDLPLFNHPLESVNNSLKPKQKVEIQERVRVIKSRRKFKEKHPDLKPLDKMLVEFLGEA